MAGAVGNYEYGTLVYTNHGIEWTVMMWNGDEWEDYPGEEGDIVTAYSDLDAMTEAEYIYQDGEWVEYDPSSPVEPPVEPPDEPDPPSESYDYDENHLVRYKDLKEIASRLLSRIEALEG